MFLAHFKIGNIPMAKQKDTKMAVPDQPPAGIPIDFTFYFT